MTDEVGELDCIGEKALQVALKLLTHPVIFQFSLVRRVKGAITSPSTLRLSGVTKSLAILSVLN